MRVRWDGVLTTTHPLPLAPDGRSLVRDIPAYMTTLVPQIQVQLDQAHADRTAARRAHGLDLRRLIDLRGAT